LFLVRFISYLCLFLSNKIRYFQGGNINLCLFSYFIKFLVYFLLGWWQIPWLSGNKICSSSHSQNTTIPDCFNSYKHCNIYLVISTFANKNILRKFFNHRRAIKIAYCPWAIRENPASSAANQIAWFIKTNACHIIINNYSPKAKWLPVNIHRNEVEVNVQRKHWAWGE
jgi:hypothetical protein